MTRAVLFVVFVLAGFGLVTLVALSLALILSAVAR